MGIPTGAKKIGLKTIEVMEYGSGGYRKKHIRRTVYRKETLSKGNPSYWFQLYPGEWRVTTKDGVRNGVVVTSKYYKKIKSS